MRHAIHVCPAQGSELMRLAGRWLGRDVCDDRARAQPDVEKIDELTAAPRRYGFHGTIVAPFRLAPHRTLDELRTTLGTFCRTARSMSFAPRSARSAAPHAR